MWTVLYSIYMYVPYRSLLTKQIEYIVLYILEIKQGQLTNTIGQYNDMCGTCVHCTCTCVCIMYGVHVTLYAVLIRAIVHFHFHFDKILVRFSLCSLCVCMHFVCYTVDTLILSHTCTVYLYICNGIKTCSRCCDEWISKWQKTDSRSQRTHGCVNNMLNWLLIDSWMC